MMRSDSGIMKDYQLIDADTHVNEPPNLWLDRVPAKFRDRAPHIAQLEDGDAWILEGVSEPINFGFNATAGMAWQDMKPWIRWEDLRPGGYDPKFRLQEMDLDQVDAHVLFPTPRLSHAVIANTDPEFHLACVRAYNDWLSEYAAYAPERLGGVALLPNRGVDGARAELQRVLSMPGIKGVLLGCYPHGDLEIAEEDDALWRDVAEAGVPLHIHVSLINEMPSGNKKSVPGDIRFYDAPRRILDFIWSGVFERVPNLNLVMAEVDCGWVPYLKEQVDDRYRRLRFRERLGVPRPPSAYLNENIYFTYISDHHAVRNRHEIGVDRMLWSSDYPHIPSDYPYSWRTIHASLSGVPEAERDRLLRDNAQGLYRFGV